MENGALFLVLFLAAGLGCSLYQFQCGDDDPHELLMAESEVYMRGNIIFINWEEHHCEERKVELNSSREERGQSSDVKVKASSKYLADRTSQTAGLFLHAAHIQELNFWNFLPFRYVSWRENEYDMARGEYYYAKVMVKLAYDEARLLDNTEIRI